VGLLKEGDAADFIVVKDLKDFEVISTYIDGTMVAGDGHCMMSSPAIPVINNFTIKERRPEDFGISAPVDQEHIKVKVIDALDGQLITTASEETLEIINGKVLPDVHKDVLKIGVVNRYHDAAPALGFVRQFGLKRGAIASSVAHDSHNIVFVGVDDESICAAVNAVIQQRGGISVCDGTKTAIMPLPVAGLMSDKDAQSVAGHYKALDSSARLLGSKLRAPFMTLSFMALPVMPSLKITDKGLFDVDQFDFTPLFIS
jgi:adenine deaminase